MREEKHIFIVCGEASGDLQAANLAAKILEIAPGIKISAVGGSLLAKTGAKIICDIKGLSVMGLFDVLIKLPHFFALKKLILKRIEQDTPNAIILVDFSGFNLRLAKAINKRIPVIYYISPQIWASRQGRIEAIKKYVHKMIVLFKFEEDFYKSYGVNVDFVGHPLLDIVKPTMEKKEFLKKYNLLDTKHTVCLLPGSRKAEIENILPVMLHSIILANNKIPDIQLVIAKSTQVDIKDYDSILNKFKIKATIIEDKAYDCISAACFCLIASGTATLEAAIIATPFAIVYKMSLLNYLLYRPQIKIPYIGMVNIVANTQSYRMDWCGPVANRQVVPEFIQFNASSRKISGYLVKMLSNPSLLAEMRAKLSPIKSLLGQNNAAHRAAQMIVNYIK